MNYSKNVISNYLQVKNDKNITWNGKNWDTLGRFNGINGKDGLRCRCK